MMLLHDRATMAHALTLDLDPQLHALLGERISALALRDGDLTDLTDWTVFCVIEPGDTEADIIREVGLSPLVEPIEGIRFPEPSFQPYWDWLADHRGWFEMIFTFGSTVAYILLIKDANGVPSSLLTLCRHYGKLVN